MPSFQPDSEVEEEAPSLEFSPITKCSNYTVRPSLDGKYVARTVVTKLVIEDLHTQAKMGLYDCKDAVQQLEWSPDSRFVMCAQPKRNIIQIWSVSDPKWQCTIDEGAVGFTAARWSPDSQHILSTAEFQVRITVWPINGQPPTFIEYPKYPAKGIRFSHDGKYLAVAQRWDSKDYVSVICCGDWSLVKTFPVDTQHLEDLAWSPANDGLICVWDSLLKDQNLTIDLQHKACLYDMEGYAVGTHSDGRLGLGLRTVAWDPQGLFVALGAYDQKVEILNVLTWKPMACFDHQEKLPPSTEFFREVVPSAAVASYTLDDQIRYEVQDTPPSIESVPQDDSKPNPWVGISQLAFSGSGTYLATRNDNMPQAAFVWSMEELEPIAILFQHKAVKGLAWRPNHDLLAVCCDTNTIYFWTPDGTSCTEVPSAPGMAEGIRVGAIEWSGDGASLLLKDKDKFCTLHFPQ